MLLPRPEISTATRLGSRMVGRGPILRRIPRSCPAADRAAALPLFNSADLEHVFFCDAFQLIGHSLGTVPGNDHCHADPAVEGPRQFFRGDPSALLQQSEDGRQLPLISVYRRMSTFRNNPWNVLEKSA